MEIIVNQTQKHDNVIVAKGTLVLVIPKYIKGAVVYINNGTLGRIPIIISETEKITEIGKYYDSQNNSIEELSNDEAPMSYDKKILVLPEQFSPETLQAIADGKLKFGDEVFVECESKYYACTGGDGEIEYNIKTTDDKANIYAVPIVETIIRKGFVQAMDGKELWVNTQTDEMIKISVRDDKTRNDFYCKHVKITIEIIDESELD